MHGAGAVNLDVRRVRREAGGLGQPGGGVVVLASAEDAVSEAGGGKKLQPDCAVWIERS